MKLLLIRFSALGDVAMLAPVLRLYAQEHPDDDLTVLSKPFHAPLFDEIAPNVHFLGRDPKRDYKGIRGLYRLFSELHLMHFDMVIDMHDVLRTKILRKFFRVHGYPVRHIDKHRSLRRRITAPEGKKQLQRLPTSFENYAAVLYGKLFEAQTLFELTREESKGITHSLPCREGRGGSLSIGLAPFAAHQGKIYPVDLMEKVIAAIDASGPCRQFVFAYGKERELVSGWEGRYPSVTLIDTRLGIEGELALISRLDVMLSMDSSNMHIASLTGTPVVSVWGATHPAAGFMGYGQKEENCVQIDLKCRPCSIYGKKKCRYGDYRCLTGIAPETVTAKVLACLQR